MIRPDKTITDPDRMSEAKNALLKRENVEPDQQMLFFRAMMRRNSLKEKMYRLKEAVSAYDSFLGYGDREPVPSARRNLTQAFHNREYLLDRMKQYREDLAIYEHLIRCYATSIN